MLLTEDDIYRSSTQFRLWSYTKSTLASLRSSTNSSAADRVRAAIQRAKESRSPSNAASADVSEAEQNGNNTKNGVKFPEKEVECLTVDEELKIVGYYCLQAMNFANHMKFPTEVKVR